MTTFILTEKTGQTFVTPPMYLDGISKEGFVYSPDNPDHSKIVMLKSGEGVKFIGDDLKSYGDIMPVVKKFEN